MTHLRSRAKDLGLSAGGGKDALVARIREAIESDPTLQGEGDPDGTQGSTARSNVAARDELEKLTDDELAELAPKHNISADLDRDALITAILEAQAS